MPVRAVFDALAIGIISGSLAAASGGGWFSWALINLAVGWLYGRITAPLKPNP